MSTSQFCSLSVKTKTGIKKFSLIRTYEELDTGADSCAGRELMNRYNYW